MWTLDTFSIEYNWKNALAKNPDAFKSILALFDEGVQTAIVLEACDKGTEYLSNNAPENVTVFRSYSDYRFFIRRKHGFELLILVSPRNYPEQEVPTLQFYPRSLHLGVGCQRQASTNIAKHLLGKLTAEGYCLDSLATIGTIEEKKDEPLMAELHKLCPRAKMCVHPAEELAKVNIPNPSEKVFETSGCYGIAESAALIENANSKIVIENKKCKIEVGGKIQHYTYALAQEYMKH